MVTKDVGNLQFLARVLFNNREESGKEEDKESFLASLFLVSVLPVLI
tara:strand:- start:223 stop:363 length:141 start_codon:yes stop_codon:yes gene_type:complete